MKEIKFRAFQKNTKTMFPIISLRKICTTSPRLTEEEYDDLIIMQSTGLFDKNGKEIFEGDIVTVEWKNFHTVQYDSGEFFFYWNKAYSLGIHHYNESEVVGNIHENPELLNK